MKICIIVGTRPEVIKMSPVIHECIKRKIDFFIIHSNQHYSPEMDEIFFEELNLPQPKYNLEVGSGKHSNQTGNILIKMEPILESEKPDFVLVQGDTNTVIAGALTASKLNIPTCHIEAGLRSYDRTMPEETNRIVTDHLSRYQFAVSDIQKEILLSEGSTNDKVFVVGNTIVDAVFNNLEIAHKKSKVLESLSIKPKEYVLLTAHRSSNVDTQSAFSELIESIKQIEESIIWPIHPRAKKTLKEFNLELPKNVQLTEPVGYLDFLELQKNAKYICTDSGGLQEEACILGTPCITLRDNTERPETINVGANILVGRDKDKLKDALKHWSRETKKWDNPFGDGKSSQYIIDILQFGEVQTDKSHDYKKTVSVIGLGYMGLPMACILAKNNITTHGFDINTSKVEQLNKGVCPFDEKGMNEILSQAVEKGLSFSTQLSKSDVYIVSVPTPIKDKKCDLTYVESAIKTIIPLLKNDDLIIVESTIKPNTCRYLQSKYLNELDFNVNLAHCPERAIPGNTLHELINNDRIVGGLTDQATKQAYDLYKIFIKGNIYTTNSTTAECCKLMENTFRDVNIALANEFDQVLSEFDVNSYEAIELANKHPRVNILSPGPGVGGHCIAIDPWFLTEDTNKAELITKARNINDERPQYISSIIDNFSKQNGYKKISLLGLAYKKNVDDCRETPATHIFNELIKYGYDVRVNDPHVNEWTNELYSFDENDQWCDLHVLITDHDIYKKYHFTKPIIDTRNLFEKGLMGMVNKN